MLKGGKVIVGRVLNQESWYRREDRKNKHGGEREAAAEHGLQQTLKLVGKDVFHLCVDLYGMSNK